MSLAKKIFGYFLIAFTFFFLIALGFPQLYTSEEKLGRVQSERIIELDMLQEDDGSIVLMYFGYVGCTTICAPAMYEIDKLYKSVGNNNLKVYFVNLSDIEDHELPDLYARQFNENFHGMYLDTKVLKNLTSEMNVIFTNSPVDSTEISHTGYLYLLQNHKDNYQLKYIYTTKPFNLKLINEDIKNLLSKYKEN